MDLSLDDSLLFLNNSINEEPLEAKKCSEKLHSLFNSMIKYNYDDLGSIQFTNGIYIILDKEDTLKNMSRIVYIGTHIGENRLIVSLKKHFKEGAKDESDLRKIIGEAILNYNELDYVTVWNMDFTNDINNKYSHLRNFEIEKSLEKMISYYMKERFEVVCFEVNEDKKRNKIVEGLLSSLVEDEEFFSGDKWLGNYSPIQNIRKRFMWIDKDFNNRILTEKEIREIIELCNVSK